jgi:O-antigen biosynthesis protein
MTPVDRTDADRSPPRRSLRRRARRPPLILRLRWRHIPTALHYLRYYGLTTLLRRALPRTRGYGLWIKRYDTIGEMDRRAIAAAITRMADPPLLSVVMPVYETPERFLRAAIDSVSRQLYPHWELCIADDASPSPHIRTVLDQYRAHDRRIKVCYRGENGHISAASNSALALAEGQFIALLDHDDALPEHALYLVAAALASRPDLDLIFSDEDKIDASGRRFEPYFKSDWNPDLMLSQNAFSHLGVYRRSLVEDIGGFRLGYEGSQDYDLVLRASTRTTAERIAHIPHILYHWRAIAGSAAAGADEKPYATDSARRALADYLATARVAAALDGAAWPGFHRVRYPLPTAAPGVSLIVPTRDRVDLLRRCIAGVLEGTDYAPLEVVIVDNDSSEPETLGYLGAATADPRVRVLKYPGEFNYSAINNFAVGESRYPIVFFLNNDISTIHRDWLKEMVSHALRPEIGAVGAKLYYPNDTVQHAGTIIGMHGTAGHAFRHFVKEEPGYFGRLALIHDVSAVTAACMVMRRTVFDEAGGFDAVNLPVAFSDVDLCLRIQQHGYRVLWTPYAELHHWESASRGSDFARRNIARFANERQFLRHRWGHVVANDPFYNPNLTLEAEDFGLAFPPRIAFPWRAGAAG